MATSRSPLVLAALVLIAAVPQILTLRFSDRQRFSERQQIASSCSSRILSHDLQQQWGTWGIVGRRQMRMSVHDMGDTNTVSPVSPVSITSPSITVMEQLQDDQFLRVSRFLLQAFIVGALTGIMVVIFKSSISFTKALLYEDLAELLPKPAFYWPLAIYPVVGSIGVSALTYWRGDSIKVGVDSIAKSIDSTRDFSVLRFLQKDSNATDTPDSVAAIESIVDSIEGIIVKQEVVVMPDLTSSNTPYVCPKQFTAIDLFFRLTAAVATLGSGCSLGPEGPSVEMGTGISRIVSGSGQASSPKERHHLFLAGTAAGVAAGFNAPITGVFFAIECGNRFLAQNTIRLDEDAPDGPRADIAAIVVAASIAAITVGLGLHESNALTITGNVYAMASPFVELPLYLGLGLISGGISIIFSKCKDLSTELFAGRSWAAELPFKSIPTHIRPIIGGVLCGLVAVYYPQTLFFGYSTLDQLLAGSFVSPTSATIASDAMASYHSLDLVPLLMQLLLLKITLTSFSLGSGLIGGVFAPCLFFGATAGTAYHEIITWLVHNAAQTAEHAALSQGFIGSEALGTQLSSTLSSSLFSLSSMIAGLTIANAPAYATVGAAATLGALFRAPLTASMLMFELTQNHDIVIPVLVSAGLGGLFAEILSQPRRLW